MLRTSGADELPPDVCSVWRVDCVDCVDCGDSGDHVGESDEEEEGDLVEDRGLHNCGGFGDVKSCCG